MFITSKMRLKSMMSLSSVATLQSTRSISTCNAYMSKNHYDSLGITPKATQKDVKDAYYKMSKMYHPDMNKSNEASKKFREVKEAYEILGNVKLRKLYDRGASNIGRQNQYPSKDDPTTRFYKAREHRTRPPPPDGRTPIYDFDEWSRAHYEATFARDMYYKRMMQAQQLRRAQDKNDVKTEHLLLGVGTIFLFFMLVTYNTNDVDRVSFVGDASFTSNSSKDDKQ